MGTERSKALHNFTMPCSLRWGSQRYLRCMKVSSNGQISNLRRFNANDSDSSDYQHQQRRTTREKQRESNGSHKLGPTQAAKSFDGGRIFENGDDDDDGIAEVREKVIFDLQAVAEQMKHQIFTESLEDGEVFVSPSLPPPPPPPPPVAADGSFTPWNLRTRRAACKAPVTGSVGGTNSMKALTADVMKPSALLSSTGTLATGDIKSPWLRSGAVAESPSGEKRERAKFSVPLLRREIEQDFIAMVGHRPPRRPKKRAKIVQKELDVSLIKFNTAIQLIKFLITFTECVQGFHFFLKSLCNFHYSINPFFNGFSADNISRIVVVRNYT